MAPYRVVISGWREVLRKVSLIQELQANAGLGLAAAKALTDQVLDGEPVTVDQPSREAAEQLARRLAVLGAVASVREAQDAEEEEFFEDFGSSLKPEELDRLLERARTTGDRDVRLLVQQLTTLRRVAADFLAYVEERDPAVRAESVQPGEPVSYPLGFLRFLLRDVSPRPDI